MRFCLPILGLILLNACSEASSNAAFSNNSPGPEVIAVDISGQEFGYSFNVTVSSPDKDCEQYADWWEVISEDGKLIYRRVLLHSHVDEQPFERSGSGINVKDTQVLIIRAHMNNLGYGQKCLKGNVKDGFKVVELPRNFADQLAKTAPLPDGCAF